MQTEELMLAGKRAIGEREDKTPNTENIQIRETF